MAKKYIGKIKVGVNKYRIYKKSGLVMEDGTGCLGKAKHMHNRILLSEGYSKRMTYKVFWHELIHCIEAERGLDLEEREVDQLMLGIVGVFADNPWLLDMARHGKFDEIFISDKLKVEDMTEEEWLEAVENVMNSDAKKAFTETQESINEIVNGKSNKK